MKTNNILSNKDFKTNISKKSRLIGIDPGAKNIGIAICDENKIVATPLKISVFFEVLLFNFIKVFASSKMYKTSEKERP